MNIQSSFYLGGQEQIVNLVCQCLHEVLSKQEEKIDIEAERGLIRKRVINNLLEIKIR